MSGQGAAVSMTGFGVGRAGSEDYTFEVEIRSVNHRFLEIATYLPREWLPLEEGVKKLIRRVARRGRVEVHIVAHPVQKNRKAVILDKELALEYDSRLKELASFLISATAQAESAPQGGPAPQGGSAPQGGRGDSYRTNVEYLASCPDVLLLETPAVDTGALWPVLEEALNEAAGQFTRMREAEGRALTQDLLGKTAKLKACLAIIAEQADGAPDTYRERLTGKLREVVGDDPADGGTWLNDTRVVQELVLAADRMTIEEEVVRLKSHIEQFGDALTSGEAIGRRLDFLIQEINREFNTIGAKAGDLLIIQQVILAKGLAENLKEQALNLE